MRWSISNPLWSLTCMRDDDRRTVKNIHRQTWHMRGHERSARRSQVEICLSPPGQVKGTFLWPELTANETVSHPRHPRCDECIASGHDGQVDDTPKPRREFLVSHPTAPLFDQIWKKSCCQHDLFMSIFSGGMEAKMLTTPVAIPEHGINRFDFAPKFGMISASIYDDIKPFESNRLGSLPPHLLFAKQNSPGFLQNHASERF